MHQNKPNSLHFAIPPEWHTHAATLMHWPSNTNTWPGERLLRVEQVFLQIIQILHQYEPILLLVESEQVMHHAYNLMDHCSIDLSRVTVHTYPINDVWTRDCGPIFIHRKCSEGEEYAITDWEFNAWGEKYPPYDGDNGVPGFLASKYGIRRFQPGMVLEGGSIDTNGKGTLMTTESVLLNPNRNPGLSKNEIELCLGEYLGIESIIWLKGGLKGDDTDGHIDDVARFLNEDTILAMVTEDVEDVNHDILKENHERLKEYVTRNGQEFTIELLPMPETKIKGTTVDGSNYVPASYANFYIGNGVVLVPTYNHRYDQQAIKLFEHYFTDRDVIGVACQDLVWGQGAIHCITQQLYGVEK